MWNTWHKIAFLNLCTIFTRTVRRILKTMWDAAVLHGFGAVRVDDDDAAVRRNIMSALLFLCLRCSLDASRGWRGAARDEDASFCLPREDTQSILGGRCALSLHGNMSMVGCG